MSSAAEAELGALYLNVCKTVYLRQILTEVGHPQLQTPIQTDNLMAEGVINNKIQPKRTKVMDMRFHWLRNCTGYATTKHKINSIFIGGPERPTLQIILQNIILFYTM
jgi:hypothetical protein